MPPLPAPEPDALEHSRALAELISGEIAAEGGWIPFSRYMELALYAPGFGYYGAGARKFGRGGDFVTAPEISLLFGRTLGRQAAEVLANGGGILELGAGTGRLAADLLAELERLGHLPAHYRVLEVSPDLRERQRETLSRQVPGLLARVEWVEHLPQSVEGLIIANEVLDALPVHLVAWRGGKIFERGVVLGDGAFAFDDRPLAEGELMTLARGLDPGRDYVSELCPAARGLVKSLAEVLARGAILFIDYGFGRREYYHPQRNRGTLMCHYRQQAHDDPFFAPGLQDITAHVDFSAVAEAAVEAGLSLLGYTTQAHFLINCGITELLAQSPVEDASRYLPLAEQAHRLLSPAEMGELFKVMALGRNVFAPLLGFTRGDFSRML
ncbi:MAG: SAM-dependent methyltransferase [Betaproteobacteria bacterium]|nr:SAM-dependent methyltransferase [Betaproteobacteria bacterium]